MKKLYEELHEEIYTWRCIIYELSEIKWLTIKVVAVNIIAPMFRIS